MAIQKGYKFMDSHPANFICELIAKFPIFLNLGLRISFVGGATLKVKFRRNFILTCVVVSRDILLLFVVYNANSNAIYSICPLVVRVNDCLKGWHNTTILVVIHLNLFSNYFQTIYIKSTFQLLKMQ